MAERIDNSRRKAVASALWCLAALSLLTVASAARGQSGNTAHFLASEASAAVKTGAASPAATKATGAQTAPETGTAAPTAYYVGTSTVNGGAALQQVVSFVTQSSSAAFVPTVGLEFGKNYSVGAVSCAPTYDNTQINPYIETCTATVTFTPLYPGGHRDAIFVFDTDGTTQLAGAFLYGIGQGPQLMIQPGVSTGVALPTNAYMYGNTVDDAGTFYVYANSSFYRIKGGVTSLLVSSVQRGQNGLSVDGAGNLFDAGNGGNSGYEYSASSGIGNTASLCHTIAGYMVGPVDYLPFTACFYNADAVAAGNLGVYYEADGGGEPSNVSGSNEYGSGLISQSYSTQGPVASPGQVGNAGSWGDAPLPYPYKSGSYSPSLIEVDAYENLFFADSNGTTRWCDWGGITGSANGCGTSTAMTLVNSISPAGNFSVDAADTLYESTSSGLEMFPASNYASAITTIGVSGYSNSNALGPDGTIYVYSPLNDVVYLFDRSQGSVNFGSNNGQTANPSTITIYNGGNEPLTLGTISLLGSTGYTLQTPATNPCSNGLTVAVGAVCLIQLYSSPTHAGVLNGAIAITSNTLNQANTIQEIALTGYTSGIYVTASPNPLDFGFVTPGQTSTVPVSLINTSVGSNSVGYGSSTVVNSGFTSSNPAFSATIGTCNESEPSGGPNCAINVAFDPSLSQSYTGTITWTEAISGSPNISQPMSLTVTGTGMPPAIPFSDLETMTISDAISLVPSTLLNVNEALTISDGMPATVASTILNVNEALHFSDTDDVNDGIFSNATMTTLAASTPVATAGNTISLTATVTQTAGGSSLPTGQVIFYEDGNPIATSMASGGVAVAVSPALMLGSHTFQASYQGNGTLTGSSSSVVAVNVVAQTVLLITPANASRNYGVANPAFSFTITNTTGGGQPTVTGAPVLSTTATQNSAAGSYPITATVGTLAAPAGHTFAFANGTLTINGGAMQEITFARMPSPISMGFAKLTLTAHSTSGLPITYTATGPASITGSTLTLTGPGSVSVTASQPGNATFAAATPVVRSFTVSQ